MKTVTPAAHSKILILDFGAQYTQVIARRVRELQVYSEVVRFDIPASEIKKLRPNGIILSGVFTTKTRRIRIRESSR